MSATDSRPSAWWRWLRKRPLEALCVALALAASGYVVLGPLLSSRYPMMTDLPFHAAYASILWHYGDPAWHFHEQFVLKPFEVPYLTSYLIAAPLNAVMSAVSAIKVATAVMLLLLPAGLAVMFWGMKKSPLLGISALGLVWGGLTSWGFINFMGALGLFAMVVGLALKQLDTPRPRWAVALGVALLVLFFTHPFRYPFALAAVAAAAALTYPAVKRARPIAVPLLLGALLFVVWWTVRPAALSGDVGPLTFDLGRLEVMEGFVYDAVRDRAEGELVRRGLGLLLGLAVALALVAVLEGRFRSWSRRERHFRIGAAALVVGCAGVFLLMYLTFPMQIGIWWYVFPREITAACFVALGLLPDLPRAKWLRVAAVATLVAATVPLAVLTSRQYRRFDEVTHDFTAVVARIPPAPKLMYLVFDHVGTRATHTPFIHLPAYVQAERGGWLSFHFADWGASPIVYRDRGEPGAVVPPPVPLRWEWTPQRFDVLEHGPFFDWFLVRDRHSPAARFRLDPRIKLVSHAGSWWLFQRVR